MRIPGRAVPWLLLGGLLLLGGGAVVYAFMRGIRNNNPGNLRKGLDRWQGLAPDAEQTDRNFWKFARPEDGIRALAVTLKTYARKYQADTVREIITRWAPPTENDTASYISSVASKIQRGPDAILSYPADLSALVQAIIQHENAGYTYPADVTARALALS